MRESQLSKKEKYVLLYSLLLLGILMIYQFLVRPTRNQLSTLKRIVEVKHTTYQELEQKASEYNRLNYEVRRIHKLIDRQLDKGHMLSRMEEVQRNCDLLSNVQYMRPSTVALGESYEQTSIEVKLIGITSAQLVEYLTQLEALKFAIGIKSAEIKQLDNTKNQLETTVQVATVTKTE